MEEEKTLYRAVNANTEGFARMVQLLRMITDGLNFNEPFRITVEYDPEQPRTFVKYYTNPE